MYFSNLFCVASAPTWCAPDATSAAYILAAACAASAQTAPVASASFEPGWTPFPDVTEVDAVAAAVSRFRSPQAASKSASMVSSPSFTKP